MASQVFTRNDRRYLARALSSGLTHGGLDQVADSAGIRTGDGNKEQRASAIVRHVFENIEDTDAEVIEILNFLYVDDPNGDFKMESEVFQSLKQHVLGPRRIELTEEGFRIQGTRGRSPGTAKAVAKPPTAPAPAPAPASGPVVTGGRADTVFIVQGRDARPGLVLEEFLHFLGLSVITWPDAVKLTGEPQPHTYAVVKAGMAGAAAVIVVFSPDEDAKLRKELAPDGKDQRGQQPRQNVLLEAGMAFASSPQKTIFVKSGATRPISDIDGFNWVKLDGEWDSRQDLLNRLQAAGADANPRKPNLMDRLAGPFKVT